MTFPDFNELQAINDIISQNIISHISQYRTDAILYAFLIFPKNAAPFYHP
jgi:hypothetical protein